MLIRVSRYLLQKPNQKFDSLYKIQYYLLLNNGVHIAITEVQKFQV
jgi:hypothetical protein